MTRAYAPRLSTVHLMADILARPYIVSVRTLPPTRSRPRTLLRVTARHVMPGGGSTSDFTLAEARAWLAADIAADAPPIVARCGRSDPHGPHTEKRPRPGAPGALLWCVGNQNVIVAKDGPA